MHTRIRRVDDSSCAGSERCKALPFDSNAVENRKGAALSASFAGPFGGKWMRSTAFAESSQQSLVARVEENNLDIPRAVGSEQLDNVLRFAEKRAYAHVNPESDTRHASPLA